jgi:kynurenine 3-monooxygenase
MTPEPTPPTFLIVGAGLAGSLMATYLGRRGFRVQVFERREDPRLSGAHEGGRSINLGLSERGIRALREIGLLDSLSAHTVPMRGRAIHRPDGELVFQPYGTSESQILHSIMRRDLNVALIDKAETYPGVHFAFSAKLTSLVKETGVARFCDERTGAQTQVKADVIVGADGAFSVVRREMQRGERADYQQEFLDWGYKELTIPPAADGSPRTQLHALHVWPGRKGLIVAHPNPDNSLTGTLFLPLAGEHGLESLNSPEAAREFFRVHFPDTAGLMPRGPEEFECNPVGTLVSVRTSPWHYEDRVVLLGDACHAVYPFYGQGMNSAFEDCSELDACLQRYPDDWATAFRSYQQRRKPHTDVLADLSKQNFVELRDHLRSPLHLVMKKTDLALNRVFPNLWTPLYTMVSHTTIPYADALARARRQDALLKWLGAGVLTGTVLSILSTERGVSLRRRVAASAAYGHGD